MQGEVLHYHCTAGSLVTAVIARIWDLLFIEKVSQQDAVGRAFCPHADVLILYMHEKPLDKLPAPYCMVRPTDVLGSALTSAHNPKASSHFVALLPQI